MATLQKRQTLRITVRLIIVLAIGLLIFYREVSVIDDFIVFDSTINFGLEVIGFLFFVWVIYKDIKLYSSTKNWTSFLPTTFGLLLIAGLLTTLYIFDLRDKSPVKFSCVSKIVDFNGVRIDFREDGTYKFDNFCMGSTFFRGTYSIKDSIITLDKENIDKVIESNRLVIRADGDQDSLGNIEKSIYQIDTKGNIIYKATDFRLLETQNK